MARPVKVGLDYFPVDTDFFSDEKIEFISAKFGLLGEAVVFRLLSKIYRNGYYIEWNDDKALLFSKKIGAELDVKAVVEELLKRDFFNRKLFDEYGILTSRGIQRRYVRACEDSNRRNSTIEVKWDLIGIKSGETEVKSDLTGDKSGFSTQSKVKENKTKQSETNEIKGEKKSEIKVKETPVTREETKEENKPQSSNTYTLFLEECFTLFHLTFHEPPTSSEKNQLSRAIRDYHHMLSDDEQFELVSVVCRKVNENTKLRADERRRYFFGTLKLLQQEACGNKSRGEALEFKQLTRTLANTAKFWEVET